MSAFTISLCASCGCEPVGFATANTAKEIAKDFPKVGSLSFPRSALLGEEGTASESNEHSIGVLQHKAPGELRESHRDTAGGPNLGPSSSAELAPLSPLDQAGLQSEEGLAPETQQQETASILAPSTNALSASFLSS